MSADIEDSKPCDNHSTSSGDDPCSFCPPPAPEYPASLMSKIVWEGSISGSVASHLKHILVCHGSDSAKWPEDVKQIADGYSAKLEKALKKATEAGDLPSIRMSVTDEPSLDEHGRPMFVRIPSLNESAAASSPSDDSSDPSFDLMMFPDQIRIHSIAKSAIPKFIEALSTYWKLQMKEKSTSASSAAVAASSSSSSSSSTTTSSSLAFPLPSTTLSGTYFLICSHKLRDKRCGISGPILADEIEKARSALVQVEQEERKESGEGAASSSSSTSPSSIHALKISHIGGHKYAGNIIVYPSGIWYGRILPSHLPYLLLLHVEGFRYVYQDEHTGERKIQRAPKNDEEREKLFERFKENVRGRGGVEESDTTKSGKCVIC